MRFKTLLFFLLFCNLSIGQKPLKDTSLSSVGQKQAIANYTIAVRSNAICPIYDNFLPWYFGGFGGTLNKSFNSAGYGCFGKQDFCSWFCLGFGISYNALKFNHLKDGIRYDLNYQFLDLAIEPSFFYKGKRISFYSSLGYQYGFLMANSFSDPFPDHPDHVVANSSPQGFLFQRLGLEYRFSELFGLELSTGLFVGMWPNLVYKLGYMQQIPDEMVYTTVGLSFNYHFSRAQSASKTNWD